MRILVLSDSHSRLVDDIKFNKYDFVIHCGDYGNSYEILKNNNVVFVRGNCDYQGDNERIITINNKKILILHGDLYNVKYDYIRLTYRGEASGASIVFFGHTHRQDLYELNDIMYINPGSYNYGDYIEIIDDKIIFYQNDRVVKKQDFRW
jgi:putative phosphoesterase